MTLWVILTIMTSVAAVLLSVPFIRRLDRPQAESAGDIEVYRDQLNEIDTEQRQGLIDETQAETARLEIKRRALAADRAEQSAMPSLSGGERNFAVICITGVVVLGSVSLYALTGSPDLSSVRGSGTSQVFAALPRDSSTREALAAATEMPASESKGPVRPQSGLPPVEEMIQRLAIRLQQNPKDAEGWRTLGWSYLSLSRFPEALEAYSKAVELNPNMAELRSARVEAMVGAAGGVVSIDAKNAIDETLKIDPRNARARFFEGLAKEQAGDKIAALADWTELLKDINPNESWAPDLTRRTSKLERELAGDTAVRPEGRKLATAGAAQEMPSAVSKGPSPQDEEAAQKMPPMERSDMIHGMVDRLASRLEKSPRDAEGWIKLIQSRMVLGETELAKQALAHSTEIFNEDLEQRDRIIAAAQQLGLSQ